MKLLLFLILALAQSGHDLERPAHWKARYDDGGSEERRFVVMRPGWRVFADPGGLFWDPVSFASGDYSVRATVFLFSEGDPEASGSARLDAPFGLFLGGSDLEGDVGHALFELRDDGRFRVSGGDWTAHDAVVTVGPDDSGPVRNEFEVGVRGDRAAYWLNGVRIAERDEALDGVIGIRAGAGLSLHVTEIEIGPNRETPAADPRR